MTSFQSAINNSIYWSGKFATIFLDSQPNKITLKVKKKVKQNFQTIKWICFSTKSGNIRVYSWSKRQGVKNITYSHKIDAFIIKLCQTAWLENWEGYESIKNELADKLSILLNNKVDSSSIYSSIAPEVMLLLKEYDVFDAIPYKLREGFKQGDLTQAVKAWFGRNNNQLVRKVSLLLQPEIILDKKYLGQPELNWLVLAKLFFQNWSIDYIYKLLEIEPLQLTPINPDKVYNLLKTYSPQSVIKFLNQREAIYLSDAAKMYDDLSQAYPSYALPKRPRSSQQLHDYLVRDYNRFRIEQTQNVVLPTSKLGYLNGAKINEKLQISVPQNAANLIEWGNLLRQCLATYQGSIISKSCYIIGILEAGVIKYCIEISQNGEILQFSGYRNCFPESQDWIDVVSYITTELHKVFKLQSEN